MTDVLELTGLRHPADASIVDVDRLVLERGDGLVLFGPNGAGKSTLLRLLAGTLPGGPRLDVAYLPQRPHLFRGRARRSLLLDLDPEERRRAEALSEQLGVADRLDAPAGDLSGGERQRLALARVLAIDAPVVLLDEPLAPLDLRDRDRAARVVTDAVGERFGIIVSHDRDTVPALGTRMAVVIAGRIRQHGPIGEVLSTPIDEDVAAVVGVGNAIGGVVERRRDPMVRVRTSAGLLRAVGLHDPGTMVTVVFGAETVAVHKGDATATSARNRLLGEVTALRPLGRLVEVVVDCGVPVVALVTPGAVDALGLEVGDEVQLSVKATAARALPAPAAPVPPG